MKMNLLLATAISGAFLLSGCVVYDEPYAVRHVSVSTGSPYYGSYNEYSPYYSYSGRRYYNSNGRYVYYSGRNPYYVSSLPSHAVYVTPRGSSYGNSYGHGYGRSYGHTVVRRY